MKHDLSEATLIGEYIGNPLFERLVRHNNETIVFYAIVDHNSNNICKLPEEVHKILNIN